MVPENSATPAATPAGVADPTPRGTCPHIHPLFDGGSLICTRPAGHAGLHSDPADHVVWLEGKSDDA